MKSHARVWLVALIAGAAVALWAPAAQASFGVEKFFAGNCKANAETCGEGAKEPNQKEAEEEGYRQAGGYVPFGITDFKLNSSKLGSTLIPEGNVKNIRVDVAPGVVTNPEAVPKCSMKDFEAVEAVKGQKLFKESTCPESSVIGKNIVTIVAEPAKGVFVNVPLEGKVYNLEQPTGLASDFGVAVNLAPLGIPFFSHTLIEGSVEWGTDYHDYFVIREVSKTLPLVESRLVFFGSAPEVKLEGKTVKRTPTTFLRNPSAESKSGPETTTTLRVESYQEPGKMREKPEVSLVGTINALAEPFGTTFALTPETTASDQPDGIATIATAPHAAEPSAPDNSDLRTATFTLPEGMTMNPSAAAGLQACTPGQIGIGVPNPTAFEIAPLTHVGCPPASKIGTASIEVPTLPAGSLQGFVYLGAGPNGELPIKGPPYTIYFNAESEKYGVQVRIKGTVTPNPATGQMTTTFSENPQAPFNVVSLHFNGGALAPIANPLACGPATTETVFTPFSGTAAQLLFSKFTVDNEGKGGACPASPAFALSQSTQTQSPNGGEHTNFTFNLTRPDGNQYLSQVKTTLPAGLDGAIPAATRCPEPQASEGTCPATSQIGTAVVEAGAGPTPFSFSGPVYLTGPYNGAPFGLSIAVPAVAGPFNLGTVVTRATINVDPYNARVTVEATLPRIVKAVGRPSSGVLLRLRKITTTINKQGFLSNPTSCAPLATESTLTGYVLPQAGPTGTEELKTPFQVANCDKLAFKPSFKATTSAKTTKANGASLETTINQAAGQANIRSVLVQLPRQLPSRLTTLQKSCPEAVFAANPFNCPSGSFVGGARANTPLLPSKLKGPAILVSHAAAAFPDLDLVMEADGVRSIVVGNTNIKNGITTTNFATTPDVPVSSITVNLPTGPHSALAAFGNLCANPLVMPTTITGWNGKLLKQKTKIAVGRCPVRIVGHKVVRNTAFLTVQTPAAGRISGSGSGLVTVSRRLNKATKTATLKVPLSRAGRQRHRPFRVRLRVGFVPKQKGPHSTASVTLTFR